MKNIAVFVSGTGSLLEAMIGDKLRIKLVMADRECRGLEIARSAGIAVELIDRKDFSSGFDRKAYTLRIIEALQLHEIDLVAMAGFMTILHPIIFESFRDRIINTHPALLPSFKGDHAVRDALAYGVKLTGCTIHIATEELDAGRILSQKSVPVKIGDSKESLHERIKKVERKLYPLVIRNFAKTI